MELEPDLLQSLISAASPPIAQAEGINFQYYRKLMEV